MKKYSVNDISLRTGLDRYKINQFSDVVKPVSWSNRGYERPNGTSVDGYKLYDETGLKKFTAISLLMKLGVNRKRIRQMFNNKESINSLYKLAADEAKTKIKEYEDILLVATNLEAASSLVGQDDLLSFVDLFGINELAEWLRNDVDGDYTKEYFSAYENMDSDSRKQLDTLLSQMSCAIEKSLDCEKIIKDMYRVVSEFTPFRELKKQNTFIILISLAAHGSDGTKIESKLLEYCASSVLEKLDDIFDIKPRSEDPESYNDLIIEDENGNLIINIKSAMMQKLSEGLFSVFDQILEFDILLKNPDPVLGAIFDRMILEDDSLDDDGREFMEALKEALLYYIHNKIEN